MNSHVRLLNIIYGYLTDGLDMEGLRQFDLTLGADPELVERVGAPSKGADTLMKLMGGKRPPAPGGASSQAQ